MLMKLSLDYIVSTLNNYLATHAYLFEGEYAGDASNIVDRYGFGYLVGSPRIRHWVYKGDVENCLVPIKRLNVMISRGLTDQDMCYVMAQCE